jgi:phage terminase Nu1 subunit (DNA packaging protein)
MAKIKQKPSKNKNPNALGKNEKPKEKKVQTPNTPEAMKNALAKARLRKENASAEKQELLAAVVRGEYVSVENVVNVWEDLTTIFAMRLKSGGKTLSNKLARKSEQEVKKIWDDFSRSLLNEVKAEIERYSDSYQERDSDADPET